MAEFSNQNSGRISNSSRPDLLAESDSGFPGFQPRQSVPMPESKPQIQTPKNVAQTLEEQKSAILELQTLQAKDREEIARLREYIEQHFSPSKSRDSSSCDKPSAIEKSTPTSKEGFPEVPLLEKEGEDRKEEEGKDQKEDWEFEGLNDLEIPTSDTQIQPWIVSDVKFKTDVVAFNASGITAAQITVPFWSERGQIIQVPGLELISSGKMVAKFKGKSDTVVEFETNSQIMRILEEINTPCQLLLK